MYKLVVQGMTCGGCANSVRRSIQSIDRGATVEVDLASKNVQVSSSVSLEAVTAAVVEAGFPVTASSTM